MCRKHVTRSRKLAAKLLAVANEITLTSDDDGCLVLEGVIRDCALKILQATDDFNPDPGAASGLPG